MAQDQSNSTGFVAPSLEELVPLFPAYELEAFIAQGGMGAVYKARQKSLDRPVAIKILPSEFGDDPQFRDSFEAEAKAMARLNHPNLISVYDFGDVGGMLYIVMEFVQGKALYYSSHNKAIDPKVALDLVSTVCRGLSHAHQGGIIHRDIKPANILLDTEANPKVGDFGLAHPVGRDKQDGLIFGTPGYTAPEIFRQGAVVDARSDLFSVGALLYELISGKQPRKDSHSMTTGTDPRIDAIIKKATNPDPNLRYPDVDKLADALDELLPKLSGPKFATAAPGPKLPSLSPAPAILASTQKKSGALPFFVISALLVGGVTAGYFMLRDPAPQKPKAPVSLTLETEPGMDKREPNPRKNKPSEKKREERRRWAERNRPKPKPDKPDPAPKPTPQKNDETPLQALARLATTLRNGDREEFPPETVKTKTSAFFLVKKNMNWDEARQYAMEHGAHLAVLSSSQQLAWFRENFKSPTPVWLGGSDSGFERKWTWNSGDPIDPSLWATGSPDNRTDKSLNGEDFLAISTNAKDLEDHYRLEKFPFLLEWLLDGSTPTSIDAQLARTGQDLNNKRSPIFPTGTFNVGGSRFLLLKRSVSWEDASILATNAGGHLAVPSNDTEATFMAQLLEEQLKEGTCCWIGGKRSPETPEIWQYVTGEAFTFIKWLDDQPDDANENEDRLAIRKKDGRLGASDESILGHDNSHLLIEWSVPSHRNMPTASALTNRNDELLEALEEVRDRIRDKYARDYRKFRKEHDEIIEDFLKNTITAINNQERLGAPIKARLVEEVKKFLEENRLPNELPRMAPDKLERRLKDAKEELKELNNDYKEEYAEAKEAYLDELLETANEALQKGGEATAKMLILENTVTVKNDERFKQILKGDKVPLPEEPREKEKDNDE